MKMITANNLYLSYCGDDQYALYLVESLREAYGGNDMPKMLNDFVFNIEMALQNAGVLDDDFNVIPQHESNCPAVDGFGCHCQ